MSSPHTLASAQVSTGTCCALFFVLIAALITGCQVKPAGSAAPVAGLSTEQLEAQRQQRFVYGMQKAFREGVIGANQQQLTGEVKLELVINRKNELLRCEVLGAPQAADAQAASKLGALAKDVCWSLVFPEVPPEELDDEGIVEVRAPLILPPMPEDQRQYVEGRQRLYAQSRFFWDRTLANQPPDSIGVATFHYRANAQGKVQECLVSLGGKRERLNDFKFDNDLQNRLTQLCKQLDLSDMPGFVVDEKGVATGLVSFDYTPWRGGPKKR